MSQLVLSKIVAVSLFWFKNRVERTEKGEREQPELYIVTCRD